jgi:hypothetical protein
MERSLPDPLKRKTQSDPKEHRAARVRIVCGIQPTRFRVVGVGRGKRKVDALLSVKIKFRIRPSLINNRVLIRNFSFVCFQVGPWGCYDATME